MERQGLTWRSDWFQLNLRTAFMKSGPGSMVVADESGDWTLEYASLEPVESPDDTIQVIREPRIDFGSSEVRSAWALLWVDSREWARMSSEAFGEPAPPEAPPEARREPPTTHPDSLFGRLGASQLGNWLREVYLEGNVEYMVKGVRQARADSLYFDRIDGHMWARNFDLAVELPIFRSRFRLKLSAEWLRHSADGSFRAENAIATTCDFEKPHYEVRIGSLQVEPRFRERPRRRREPGKGDTVEEPDGWDIAAIGSSMSLGGQAKIPLPKMEVPLEPDNSGGLRIDSERLSLGGLQPIQFGKDSKLGSFISTKFTTELGFAAKTLHRALGGRKDLSDLEGRTSFRPAYNNDRGPMLGVETEMAAEDRYTLLFSADVVDDAGEDRGLVRVDEADRDRLRGWYRARGRYLLGDREWLDVVVTHETDPGVQSEFFESDYLRFEERESYLHWRRAEDPNYFAVTLEHDLDDFRSEVEEQPSILHARGRSTVGSWRGVPLQYSSRTGLAYLKRRESNLPTEPPFPDGFGEQDALRFDTDHRLEAPIALGTGGLRAVPFVEARATAWQMASATGTGPEPSAEDPTRFALLAGAEVATTLWRVYPGGGRHFLIPFAGVRGDLAVEDSGAPLVRYDRTEDPLDGHYVDVGVRSHWTNRERPSFLDLELVETRAADTAPGAADGWLPLRVHGSWFTPLAGMPFGVSHDARYDLEDHSAPYSYTRFGLEPIPEVAIEAGYHSARDLAGEPLYNVLTSSVILTPSPKWEIEGGYGFSTQGDGHLSSDVEIRRIGHDFVFSVSYRFLAGEGGSSINYSIAPLLGWSPSNPSFLRRLRDDGD